MGFFTFIAGIVIIFFVIDLSGRVKKLEQFVKSGGSQGEPGSSLQLSVQQLKAQPPAVDSSLLDYIKQQQNQGVAQEEIEDSLLASGWQSTAIKNAFAAAVDKTQIATPPAVPEQAGPILSDKFVDWLKEDWLLKLGALLLLMGFGWLTTYAFLNNWIGPMGRIGLGIIAGALFMLLGYWRIKNYTTQGGIFLVLGSTIILLTIFAARTVYDFFTPLSALAVMFLSTAFVAFASIRYNSRVLSLLSLVLAGMAPLLTKSPATDHVGLFAYLLIVILGAIWIVILTGQRELTAASLIIISAYSAPHLLAPSLFPLADNQLLLLFAYAFAALFFLTNTAGILKLKDKEIVPDLITAAGNGLFLLAWIMAAAPDEWKSLIIASWMVVFVVGAFLIFKITQRREPFYVYVGIGIAMLAAATAAELRGATLTIAYTVESGIIALIAYAVLKDIKIAERTSLLLIGPAVLSVSSMTSRAWLTGVIHKDFFILLVLSLTMLGLGLFFLRRVREIDDKEPRQLNTAVLTVGSIYAYVLLWLSLRTWFFDDNLAVMISLVIYTIIGLVSYFYGFTNSRRGLYLYGGALVGFVVVRLLLVDVWKMELAGRIVTFFLIGALLVSTAFFGKNKIRKRDNE